MIEPSASFNRIVKEYDSFTGQQKKIAGYIISYFDEFVFFSISQIAAKLSVSKATIVRFAQQLGYSGFPELKEDLFQYYRVYLTPAERLQHYIGETKNEEFTYASITRKELKYLEESISTVDERIYQEAIQAICKAESVYIYGSGPNEPLAGHLAFRLSRFKLKVIKMSDSGKNLFEKLFWINRQDFVVVYAFNKPSTDYISLMEVLKEKGTPVLLITDTLVPPMIRYTRLVLYAKRGPIWLFHSPLVPMAITNALIIGVANQLGEKAVDSLKELSEMRRKYYDHEGYSSLDREMESE
ncbi:MAG: MurR/RpiR family transcriptional regulator [Spirochaetota bacterium]